MKISSSHRGANRPFERDRRLTLRCIPAGAIIQSAVASVSPVSDDDDGRFLETIDLTGVGESWGATKRRPNGAVEIDLRARRKLATVFGTNLDGATLHVDLGGGFTPVDANGSLGGGAPFPLTFEATQALPGLTAAGFRIALGNGTSGPDVFRLEVASPPANLTFAIDAGPIFWTHFGDLVAPVTTPDFAPLLQEAIDLAPVDHGHHRVDLVIHSDTITRLDVQLDIDFVLAASATPDGVDQVSLPFEFGSRPEGVDSALAVSIPSGSVVAPGTTGGRVQGSFEPSRIVVGTLGDLQADSRATIRPSSPHAQPLVVAETTLAGSVDLRVAATTPSAEVAVDIVGDLDGRPDQVSLLPELPTRRISRDDAPDLTWLNVALPGEIELHPDQNYWIVIHCRDGTIEWATGQSPESPLTLHATTDNGLSWRATGSETVAAQFRLRHTTPGFRMPLELRVDAGAGPERVDLQHLAASGRVDFGLDFDEVGEAINAALSNAGAGPAPTAEHIANGNFEDWFRLGSNPTLEGPLNPLGHARRAMFSPDGNTIHLVTTLQGGNRLEALHTYCNTRRFAVDLPHGTVEATLIDQTGSRALVSTLPSGSSVEGSLTIIDLTEGRVIGEPIGTSGDFVSALAAVPDGSGVYAAVDRGSGTRSLVARFSWSDLVAFAGGSEPAEEDFVPVEGSVAAVEVGGDGTVYVISRPLESVPSGSNGPAVSPAATGDPGRIDAFDPRLVSTIDIAFPNETIANPRRVAIAGSGHHLIVASAAEFAVVDLVTGNVTVRSAAGHTTIRDLAADPTEDSVLVVADRSLHRLDPSTGRLDRLAITLPDAVTAAISPPGNRLVITMSESRPRLFRFGEDLPEGWEVTTGQVSPGCFGDPVRPVATLGRRTGPQPGEVRSAALSQVVPAAPSTRYRFAFSALADLHGATAEILWRTEDCGIDRVDQVPIDSLERRPSGPQSGLTHHERELVSPDGAVAAEVRFVVPEDQLNVTGVSLAGSNDVVGNASLRSSDGVLPGWNTTGSAELGTGGGVGRDGGNASTVIDNPSSERVVLSQDVQLNGSRYELSLGGRVEGNRSSTIELVFLTETLTQVGDPIRLLIEPFAFDFVAAAGEVPHEASDARLSIEVPPGGSLDIDRLSLEFPDPVPVAIDLISEAPGRLLVSEVVVGIDRAPPSRPPVPGSGLCPAIAPSHDGAHDERTCHCQACGQRAPIRHGTDVVTAGGRAGQVSTCPSCSAPRLSLGGEPDPEGRAMPFASFRLVEPPKSRLGVASGVRVQASMADIDGISTARTDSLQKLGIRTPTELAGARPETVAKIRGVSPRMARGFISQARELIRREGRPVLVERDDEAG